MSIVGGAVAPSPAAPASNTAGSGCATPGVSVGYDECQKRPECLCDYEVVTCPDGGFYVRYFVTESCTPTGTPAGTDPGTIPPVMATECSAEKFGKVLDAFQLAGKMLERAINRISDAQAAPGSSLAKRVQTALRAHFGFGDPRCAAGIFSEQQVRENLEKLLHNIGAPVQSKCPAEERVSPNSTAEELRHVRAAPLGDDSNHFAYYPSYFKGDPTSRARTVIHEMAHSWLHFSDSSYHGQSRYPGCPGVALENPDSYAWFVQDLTR